MITKLYNNIVRLRAMEKSDVELLYDWENNPEIWQVSNRTTPFSKEMLEKYIEVSHLDIYENNQLRLMIDSQHDNKTIGCIDFFDFSPLNQRTGIGILIANKESRHQGFASESIKIVCQYAFKVLLIHQLYCNICEDNKVSIQLFTKLGFKQTGVRKDWYKTINGWKNELNFQLINPYLSDT